MTTTGGIQELFQCNIERADTCTIYIQNIWRSEKPQSTHTMLYYITVTINKTPSLQTITRAKDYSLLRWLSRPNQWVCEYSSFSDFLVQYYTFFPRIPATRRRVRS